MSEFEAGPDPVEVQTDAIRSAISEANGLNKAEVELSNVEKFVSGSRFVYVRTPTEFGKYTEATNDEDRRTKLRRESIAGKVVAEMGIPSVPITRDYQEVGEKGASIFFEKLSSEAGIIFASPQEIAGIEPELVPACARASAEVIISLGEQPIPANVPSEALMRTESLAVYNSPERMREHFERLNGYINQERFGSLYDEIIGPVTVTDDSGQKEISGSEYFTALLSEYRGNLEQIIKQWPSFEEEFLVHGDAEPKNFYLKTEADGLVGIPIDFEYAGATHDPILGAVHDLSNFQSRLWPNPEYQNEFAGAIFDSVSRRSDVDTGRLVARSVAILAATKLASYPLRNVDSGAQTTGADFAAIPHSQAVFSELASLPDVLATIDDHYLAGAEVSPSIPEPSPGESPDR